MTGAVLAFPAVAFAQVVPQASIEQGGAPQALAFGGGCLRGPLTTVCSLNPADYPAPALDIDPAAPFTVHLGSEVNAVRVRSRTSAGSTVVAVTLTDPHTATVTPSAALAERVEVSVNPVIGGDENYAGSLPAAPAPPVVQPALQPAPAAAGVTLDAASRFRLGALGFTAGSSGTSIARVTVEIGGVRVTRSVTFTKPGPLTFEVKTTAAQNRRLRRALARGAVGVRATISVNGTTATGSSTLRR